MATWAKCPDLFLYTKGNDVYLWRCRNETTTWMPMITANFEDLGKVTDYLDLIGGKDSILEWEKSSYIDLVAYISPRRLLVNCRGLLIAELHEFDQDGRMEENGLPIYIRSLDVLSLKPFGLRDRTIPSRTVRYLETEGKAAPVEDSSTTTTTSTELDEGKRADMEKQVAELKAAIKTLKSDKEAAEKQVTKLTEANETLKSDKEALKSDKEAAEQQANDLKDRNKSLVEDVAAQKTAAEKAQQERDAAKRKKEAAEKQVAKLKETNKTLKTNKDAAEKKAVELQAQLDALPVNEKKEVWMNSHTDQVGSNWSTIGCLGKFYNHFDIKTGSWLEMSVVVAHGRGSFYTTEDLTTNVRASYMYNVQLRDGLNCLIPGNSNGGYKAIRFNDLNPGEEKAKFSVNDWYRHELSNGDIYAIRLTQ